MDLLKIIKYIEQIRYHSFQIQIWNSIQYPLLLSPAFTDSSFSIGSSMPVFKWSVVLLYELIIWSSSFLLMPFLGSQCPIAFSWHIDQIWFIGQSVYYCPCKGYIIEYFIPSVKCKIWCYDHRSFFITARQ